MSAASSNFQATATVEQPRPFGYVVGDLMAQRVLLPGGLHSVDATSLPKAGRVGAWLERRPFTVVADTNGRSWLVVDYQLINAPQGIVTINIPTWDLRMTRNAPPSVGNTATLHVPSWPVSIQAMTQRTVLGQGGLQELRADRPAPTIQTGSIVQALEGACGALVLVLLAWLGWFLWRNWRAAHNQPFARAAREIRDTGEDSAQAWQALHRAFDRTAGRTVQQVTLPSLFQQAGHLDTLRPRIEEFFAQSRERFFGGELPEKPVRVAALCAELRLIERRHER